MLIGKTGCGKTTMYEIMVQAHKSLNRENHDYKDIFIKKLNPKSVEVDYLYGYPNDQTNEWIDGIISKTIKYMIDNKI